MGTPMEQEPKSGGQVDWLIIYKDSMKLNRNNQAAEIHNFFFDLQSKMSTRKIKLPNTNHENPSIKADVMFCFFKNDSSSLLLLYKNIYIQDCKNRFSVI